MTRLKIRPFSAVGAEVSGVELADELSPRIIEIIKAELLIKHVLVFRDQSLTSEQQIRFANRIGTATAPEPSKGLTTHEEARAEIQWLAYSQPDNNRPADPRPTQADAWHTDYSYLSRPPDVSFLYAVEIPSGGPDTLYIDMQRAYENLPPAKQQRYNDLRAIHVQKGALDPQLYRLPPYVTADETTDERLSPERRATHPLIRTNPLTGRKFLYISQCYTVGFEGMPAPEGQKIIADIYRCVGQPEFSYQHVWRRGDCVISHNLTTNHRRSKPLSSLTASRILSRVMVNLDGPTD